MTAFDYRNGELYAEGVALSAIAEQYDTPCFVYSRAAIEQAYDAWDSALEGVPHLVCFAVKANSNLGVQPAGPPRCRLRHRFRWRTGARAGRRR